jgi:hypothetical protein
MTLAGASTAAASTRCVKVYMAPHGRNAKVRVVRGTASWHGARGLIHDAFTAFVRRPNDSYDDVWGITWNARGWRCSRGLGGSQAFCFRGNREIDGSLRSDDGWSF